MPYVVGGVLEIISLLILMFFTFYRRTFRIITRNQFIREAIQVVFTVAAIIDIIVALSLHSATYVAIHIRPLLFILIVR